MSRDIQVISMMELVLAEKLIVVNGDKNVSA